MVQKNKPYTNLFVQGHDKNGQALVELENTLYSVDPRSVAPGDKVTIQVLHHKRKLAKVVSVEEKSPNHRVANCPHFGVCGGCSYQHLDYHLQLSIKQSMVEKALDSTSLVLPEVSPIIACDRQWKYRNKMEYTLSARSWLEKKPESNDQNQMRPGAIGFFVPFSGNKVLDLMVCHLQDEPSTQIRNWLKVYITKHNLTYHNGNTHEGFLRTLLVRNTSRGENLVTVVFHPEGGIHSPHPSELETTRALELLRSLSNDFPSITSLHYTWNYKLNDTYGDLNILHYSGSPWITEVYDGIRFRVGPLSFMQVNPWQTPLLYNLILQQANVDSNDIVYDLYCGAGTISAYLSKKCKKVIGIEVVKQAIDHAQEMAIENNIDNVSFYVGDMKDVLRPDFVQKHGNPDVLVVDPPRAGLHKDVIGVLNSLTARTLVYVSCKPESLARDLQSLATCWEAVSIIPMDLMPQTLHIETIVTLRPRNS